MLLPLGIARLWRGSRQERMLVAALATAPLAAVMTGTIDLNRYRAMFVLPFGALFIGQPDRQAVWTTLLAAVPVALVVLFAWFALFYSGGPHLPARAQVWLTNLSYPQSLSFLFPHLCLTNPMCPRYPNYHLYQKLYQQPRQFVLHW